jgi:hypothetical protein
MWQVVRVLFCPLQRAWALLAIQSKESVPRPTDEPQSHAPGPDQDRVLLIGSGAATGWGVRTHDLALPGALARALPPQTGRGADVQASANPVGSITDGLRELGDIDLSDYHAVVVVMGVNDAIGLLSPKTWQVELARILSHIAEHADGYARVYLLGIQPIRTIPAFDNVVFGTIANWHATTLNRVSARHCAATPSATFVPMTGRAFVVGGRYSTSTDYQKWGEFLATEMAAGLTETSLNRRRA